MYLCLLSSICVELGGGYVTIICSVLAQVITEYWSLEDIKLNMYKIHNQLFNVMHHCTCRRFRLYSLSALLIHLKLDVFKKNTKRSLRKMFVFCIFKVWCLQHTHKQFAQSHVHHIYYSFNCREISSDLLKRSQNSKQTLVPSEISLPVICEIYQWEGDIQSLSDNLSQALHHNKVVVRWLWTWPLTFRIKIVRHIVYAPTAMWANRNQSFYINEA